MTRTPLFRSYFQSTSGAVSVSTSFVVGIFILLIGGGIEVGHAYWKSNALQHAARMGVRVATTSDPVAAGLTTITGLQGSTNAGDPMPAYSFTCSGKTKSCNQGGFDETAFNKIVFGRDDDGKCLGTTQERRGMCDYFEDIKAEHVTVSYEGSGLGRAGSPPDLMPLVTISIANVEHDYVFVDVFASTQDIGLLGAEAVSLAEDLRSGT